MRRRAAFLVAVGTVLVLAFGAGSGAAATNTFSGTMVAPYWSGSSYQICTGVKSTTTVAGVTTQTCTVTQASGTCIQVSTAQNVVQMCDFTQAPTGKNNRALAIQIAVQKKNGPSGEQEATQNVFVDQQNNTFSNFATVGQGIRQALGRAEENGDDDDDEEYAAASVSSTTAPITQSQESHQSITVCQGGPGGCELETGMTGNNTSNILQALGQSEVAAKAPSITQLQNTESQDNECTPLTIEDTTANMCAQVEQNTDGGRDVSRLLDPYRQFQSARKTLAGEQTQGNFANPLFGGLDHFVEQNAVEKSDIWTSQNEVQIQRAVNTAALEQSQHGPIRKGVFSTQIATDEDDWTGRQTSKQFQTNDGVAVGNQTNLLNYWCDTTGDCMITQSVNENGEVTTNECAPGGPGDGGGDFCNILIDCGNLTGSSYLTSLLVWEGPNCIAFATPED